MKARSGSWQRVGVLKFVAFVVSVVLLATWGYSVKASAQTTPIQHLVVIFQENVSFDHYFGTYPKAANLPGEPAFEAKPGTPTVNGLTPAMLTNNPNANNPANAKVPMGANPFRLDRTQAATCSQDHDYMPEQLAFDGGLMDNFPLATGEGTKGNCRRFAYGHLNGIVMGYYDGNTVTALWNYAQAFAMNDNSYGTTFGPSVPGALNLVSGLTYPVTPSRSTGHVVAIKNGVGTLIDNVDPTGDVCSHGVTVSMGGSNIGDLLNKQGITWGWFEGGFNLTIKNPNGSTGCRRSHPKPTGGTVADYAPHHESFQYFAGTANPRHIRPNSVQNIGTSNDGGANHQYDIQDFFDALAANNMPSVTFLKAPRYEDGHPQHSSPLLEQQFLVSVINQLESSPFWPSMAIIINWDDSDGWYDHQMGPIVNPPQTPADVLSGKGVCGSGTPMNGIQGRCGYGPRLPLMVISPYAKSNFVDNTLTDQTSILRFIEDNWQTGQIGGGSFDAIAGTITNMFNFQGAVQAPLFLDPNTGEPTDAARNNSRPAPASASLLSERERGLH